MRNLWAGFLLFLSICAHGAPAADFPALGEWKNALISGSATDFRKIYSVNPPARFAEEDQKTQDISKEIDFWQQIKQSGMADLKLSLASNESAQGLKIIGFEASYRIKTPEGPRTRYVTAKQAWMQQGSNWRVVIASHSQVMKMPRPSNFNPKLYKGNVDARAEIKAGLARAAREHKRVLLVFGANWCIDCHVLEFALHHGDMAEVTEKGFVVVHVDIGEGDLNADLVAQYGIPAKHGVPVLAVLSSDGKILYSDTQRQFQSASRMDPDEILAFLNKWKPKA
jgi:hypothetical protein